MNYNYRGIHISTLCVHTADIQHTCNANLFTQHGNGCRLRQKGSIAVHYHNTSIYGIFGVFSVIKDSCREELLRDEIIVREMVFEC